MHNRLECYLSRNCVIVVAKSSGSSSWLKISNIPPQVGLYYLWIIFVKLLHVGQLTAHSLLSHPARIAGASAICSATVPLFLPLGPDFLDNGSRPSFNGSTQNLHTKLGLGQR